LSAQVFEKVLARLYTDAAFRTSFLENPLQALADEDLNADERDAFTRIHTHPHASTKQGS